MYKNTYVAVVSVSVASINSQSQTTALQLYELVHVPCMSKTVNIPEWWFHAAVL